MWAKDSIDIFGTIELDNSERIKNGLWAWFGLIFFISQDHVLPKHNIKYDIKQNTILIKQGIYFRLLLANIHWHRRPP